MAGADATGEYGVRASGVRFNRSLFARGRAAFRPFAMSRRLSRITFWNH